MYDGLTNAGIHVDAVTKLIAGRQSLGEPIDEVNSAWCMDAYIMLGAVISAYPHVFDPDDDAHGYGDTSRSSGVDGKTDK